MEREREKFRLRLADGPYDNEFLVGSHVDHFVDSGFCACYHPISNRELKVPLGAPFLTIFDFFKGEDFHHLFTALESFVFCFLGSGAFESSSLECFKPRV